MYDEIKEFVAFILKRNGFRVKKDFRCPEGWIDVAGFKRGFSVGIEIGNPENVTSKLMSYPFSTRIVICDDCDYRSGEIIVTDINSLCKALNIDCNPSFEEWLKQKKDDDYKFYRVVFDHLREKLSDDAVARRAIDAVIYLYMAEEVIEDYSGKVTEKIPFVRLYPTLVECGLAIRDTKDIFAPKTFMTSLTRDGFRVAKIAVREKLRKKRNEIEDIIDEIGREVLFVITTGLAERKGLVLREVDVESFEISGECLDEIYYSILPIFASIDIDDILKMFYGKEFTPLTALCKVLSYTVFYHKARDLFERLFKISLASKVPVHDYYGEFFGYEYRTSKEVAEFLSKFAYAKIDSEILHKFYNILLLAFLKGTRTKDLEVALERGIVREKPGGLEIVDRERFKEFIKARMARIAAEAVESIFSSRASSR